MRHKKILRPYKDELGYVIMTINAECNSDSFDHKDPYELFDLLNQPELLKLSDWLYEGTQLNCYYNCLFYYDLLLDLYQYTKEKYNFIPAYDLSETVKLLDSRFKAPNGQSGAIGQSASIKSHGNESEALNEAFCENDLDITLAMIGCESLTDREEPSKALTDTIDSLSQENLTKLWNWLYAGYELADKECIRNLYRYLMNYVQDLYEERDGSKLY